MKRFCIAIGGIVTIILIITLIIVFAWTIFGGGSYFKKIPDPEITYGEFPFKLKYEINGEIKTIEDTIICKFDGFEVIGEAGKYRKWKSVLKSGNERITLLDLCSSGEVNEFGKRMLELYFYYGNAEYYMGDIDEEQQTAQGLDRVSYLYQNQNGTLGGSGYDATEAYEKYKIRLISWEVASPIENVFK